MPKKANYQFARTNILKIFNTPIYRCEIYKINDENYTIYHIAI